MFGVLVLSFAAANSGGITRDLLIGVIPPGAIGDWRYLGVSLFAGIITFCFSSLIVRMSNSVLLFDAAGLAFFAVTGASKALAHGLNPVMAIVLGMVTGIGGGMVRDVLLAEIPTVLRAELYAVAALAAAAISGGRAHAAVTRRTGDGGSADFMLLAPRHGDQARLAASGCKNPGSRRFGCWKSQFERSREILAADAFCEGCRTPSSDAILSCVMWPSTPVGRQHLA